MAFGVGQNALPVTHAASLVIACANTQRRSRARDRAAEYLARTRVLTVQSVQDDQAMASQARAEADDAKRNLQREVKRAYQHYAYLVRNPEGELTVGFGKFDDDAKTALSGANVWDKLAQEGRAVTPGALNLDGLMLSLENQLPRSLSEVVNLFWTNPRMPMLSGVEELRRALFEALRTDRLEIVNGEGVIQAPVDKPTDLPIASHSLTLRLPTPAGRVSTDGSNGDSSYGESGDYSLFPIADDVGVNGDRTETEGSKGSVVSSGERVSLWLKAQASLASHDKQEAMGALLQHIKILITNSKPDEVENIILTVEFVGDKAKLQSCVRSAERLHGTKHQFEDLP
jgi:hypothetical protein